MVIQDILKALIKNNYNTSYSTDLYEQEIEELEDRKEEERKQVISKFPIYFIRDLLINFRFINLEKS